MRAGRAALPAAFALFFFSGAAGGEADRHLHLCNPGGEIRADRTRRGLRIRYLDKSGRADKIDFTLPGWEVRSASVNGGKACLDLGKRVRIRREKSARPSKPDGKLSAKDEVIEHGGAFQDKVILRRGRRVIGVGGEKITIKETEVISSKGKKGPQETKPE
ncbi:MAG: hypothetical protein V3U53_03925 [bacterium]